MTPLSHPKPAFEIIGYFESLYDLDARKCIGTRGCAEQSGRAHGSDGQRDEEITANIVVNRGHKIVRIKASPEKPLRVRTTYLPLCGRMLRNS